MCDNPKHDRICKTLFAVNNAVANESLPGNLIRAVTRLLTSKAEYLFAWIALFDKKNHMIDVVFESQKSDFNSYKTKVTNGTLPNRLLLEHTFDRLEVYSSNPDELDALNNSRLLFAPLYFDNELHGFLQAALPIEWARSDDEISLFKQIAKIVAYAVNNQKEKQDILSLFTKAEEGYVIFDNELNIVSVNQSLCDFFEHDKLFYIGKNLYDVLLTDFKGDGYDFVYEAYEQLKKGEDIGPLEIKFNDKAFRFSSRIHSLSKYRIGILHDLTHINKNKSELLQTETQYRTLFNATNDAILIHTLAVENNSLIVDMNEQACKQYGYTREDFLRLNIKDLLLRNEYNVKKSLDNRQKLYEKGWTICELEHKKKSGEVFPVEISSRLFEIENRKMILSLIRDISDRKLAEKKQAESENILTTVLQSMPSGFFMIDENYVIQDVNELACKVTGYEREELIGKECDVLCPKGKRSGNCPIWEKGKEAFANKDTFIKDKNDQQIPILKNAQKVKIGDNHFILESFQDTTLLKETEKELLVAKNKAEEGDKLKSTFLSNMSHEIRTPMNSIIGFSEQLKSPGIAEEEKNEYIEIIQSNSRRIQSTINDILDISKIESGIEDIKSERISLNGFMKEIHSFFESDAADKQLSLVLDCCAESKGDVFFSDVEKLSSILSNIIKNAIKFTLNGLVNIGCTLQDENIEFYIKDSGIGIPEEKQQAIFEAFVQADSSGTRLYEGAGLGLSIAKAYTLALGGTIRFESEADKGTTFYVNIPMNLEGEQEIVLDQKPMDETKDENKKLKILIVEDDSSSLLLLKTILKSFVGELIHTDNGKKAVELVQTTPDIDLVIMDVKLYGINGFEATSQIREFNNDVKIIAQTAYVSPEDNLKAFEVGCDDFITKPIIKRELLQSVRLLFEV